MVFAFMNFLFLQSLVQRMESLSLKTPFYPLFIEANDSFDCGQCNASVFFLGYDYSDLNETGHHFLFKKDCYLYE